MIGLPAIVFDLAIVFAPVALVVGTVYSLLKYRTGKAFEEFLIAVAITILWIPLPGIRLYLKAEDYLFLKTLDASNVVGIRIGNKELNREENIRKIVALLNQAEWHVNNHDGGLSGDQFLTILSSSGYQKDFHIGQYLDRDAAIVGFFRPWRNGYWVFDNALVPSLPSLLQELTPPGLSP